MCGFVTYEAACAFQPHLRVHEPMVDLPLAFFAAFDGAVRRCDAPEESVLRGLTTDEMASSGGSDLSPMWWIGLPDAYRLVIEDIRQSIARGEVYQVNMTGRIAFRGSMEPGRVYEALRRSQTARYSAWLYVEPWDILSVSPELFYRRDGRTIVTRPMKGTAPRAQDRAADMEIRARFEQSEKERAENVMIVDLLRNDLGQIAVPGTVQVDRLFEVEGYPTVWQMTSTISCTLRPEVNTADIFRALFPCGSVTGAPKAASMKDIAKLERMPRGVYCGAIGLWTPDDREVWSVAIRTLVGRRDRATWLYGTGSGITWDSSPVREEAEVLLKAAVLRRAGLPPLVELLETMRLDGGTWLLYEEHRARMLQSARTFRIPLEPHALDEALAACAAEHPVGTWRVRVCVSISGRVSWEAAEFEGFRPALSIEEAVSGRDDRTLVLSPEPVDRRWFWLYHKTTDRGFYDRIRSRVAGAFDVLLYNEDGEVTEGTFGNIAYELEGAWYTPPVECGLLPGTLRSRLLRRGEMRERVLHRSEMQRVTRWCWLNGLRGVVQVKVADSVKI